MPWEAPVELSGPTSAPPATGRAGQRIGHRGIGGLGSCRDLHARNWEVKTIRGRQGHGFEGCCASEERGKIRSVSGATKNRNQAGSFGH